jgi:hypothetical protein
MSDDPTSTTFVGSHEKSRAGYGTNGDFNPSSVPLGKQPKLVEPKVAPPDASAEPWAGQTHDLNVKTAAKEHQVPTHAAMAGNMPAKLPGKGTSPRPSSVAAKPGSFAR